MGFFGRFLFADGSWEAEALSEPYLAIEVLDSDIATIDYAPAADGASGRCYLGFEPRHYYDDPTQSEPVDTVAEARGLAGWARSVTGADVAPRNIKGMLASSQGKDPEDDFVEDTLVRLLPALGLPVPEGLGGG